MFVICWGMVLPKVALLNRTILQIALEHMARRFLFVVHLKHQMHARLALAHVEVHSTELLCSKDLVLT